uniref:Uncharacterized protein n=1 Tax=Strongyloides stercoralis TaxID=6248 RepID=A0AAF5DQX2_STRER
DYTSNWFVSTMNNAASIIFIIFLGSVIFFSHGCNVKLNITNGTEKKFQLQVTALSIKYKNLKKKKTTQLLNGKNCAQKKWIIQMWKKNEKGDTYVTARSLEAKFNGNGYMRIMIGDDFRPWVNDRKGIHCSEGLCM